MKTLYLLVLDPDLDRDDQADGRIVQILMENPPPEDSTPEEIQTWLNCDDTARSSIVLALSKLFSWR